MSRPTITAINRKFTSENGDTRVYRMTNRIPAQNKKVGRCMYCWHAIFAGNGQVVRTRVHRKCQKNPKEAVKLRLELSETEAVEAMKELAIKAPAPQK